jgi:hypothetical protein
VLGGDRVILNRSVADGAVGHEVLQLQFVLGVGNLSGGDLGRAGESSFACGPPLVPKWKIGYIAVGIHHLLVHLVEVYNGKGTLGHCVGRQESGEDEVSVRCSKGKVE